MTPQTLQLPTVCSAVCTIRTEPKWQVAWNFFLDVLLNIDSWLTNPTPFQDGNKKVRRRFFLFFFASASCQIHETTLGETHQQSNHGVVEVETYWCWTKNRGGFYPPKWMVYFMENPMNKWMIWGYRHFWKHPYLYPPEIWVFKRCWKNPTRLQNLFWKEPQNPKTIFFSINSIDFRNPTSKKCTKRFGK